MLNVTNTEEAQTAIDYPLASVNLEKPDNNDQRVAWKTDINASSETVSIPLSFNYKVYQHYVY